MFHRSSFRVAALLILAAIPFAAFAEEPIATARGGGASVTWQVNVTDHDSVILRVSSPRGDVRERRFANGETVTVRVQDLGAQPANGEYNWELFVVPRVSAEVARQLAEARAANDEEAARRIMEENGLTDKRAWGALALVDGRFADTEAVEGGQGAEDIPDALRDRDAAPQSSRPPGKIAVNDFVIADDLIVQGSTCIGFDCINGEVFSFDTLRLKENNLRIHFDDTSTLAGFPANDWRIIANDSASGGASKLSVEDSTGAKTPLTIEAGATTNSIFADSTGRIGFRTSTPVLDLHINTSNTPGIRLEQNNSGGFTAQTWDMAANEIQFFVRDVTGGSKLPFRIRPGAPTSSVDISASGAVGINDASPNSNSKLDVNGAQRFEGIIAPTIDNAAWLYNESGVGLALQAGGSVRIKTGAVTSDRLTVTSAGDVGFNCNAPTADFVIFATSNCAGAGSTINAGATQFTVASSRAIKENLEPVAVPDLLDRIAAVDVYKYDFKDGAKNRLGLMAEDFHGVFGRGSDKVIDGNEVQMALWMAVQQLAEQNKQLMELNQQMREQNQQIQEQNRQLHERLSALENQ